jgi:hypothetical protein
MLLSFRLRVFSALFPLYRLKMKRTLTGYGKFLGDLAGDQRGIAPGAVIDDEI